MAAVATLLSIAALIVVLLRTSTTNASPVTTPPTFTAGETSAAHQKLCDSYRLVARAVQIETNGTSPERAGIAEVNGAMTLKDAVDAYPAITSGDRAAAVALARAYNNLAAVASLNDSSLWQSALDDTNAKDAAMKKVCGGS
ncbi:hypothetical protein [Mycobacterium sp. E3305]|uniref:hypothetical protein n=1 Tax=Mycobacterium sp. E3305 TaxID=1834145 RepID=UPI00350FBBFC